MTGCYTVALIGSNNYVHLSAVRALVGVLCARPLVQILTRGTGTVDRAVRAEARALGVPVEIVRASAVPVEHTLVAAAQEVHAFWDGRSAGTRHAIQLARAHGVPVHVHGLVA